MSRTKQTQPRSQWDGYACSVSMLVSNLTYFFSCLRQVVTQCLTLHSAKRGQQLPAALSGLPNTPNTGPFQGKNWLLWRGPRTLVVAVVHGATLRVPLASLCADYPAVLLLTNDLSPTAKLILFIFSNAYTLRIISCHVECHLLIRGRRGVFLRSRMKHRCSSSLFPPRPCPCFFCHHSMHTKNFIPVCSFPCTA